MSALITWQAKQLDLIRNTVAKDCNASEFDTFIHICKTVRLDPIRRQIYAFVFNKDSDARQLTVVTSIGGYRSIAERTGNYRPGETTTVIEDGMADQNANPLGISHATATVHKFVHGDWHAITETAYWEEFAPIMEEGDGGFDWVGTGTFYPDGHKKAGKERMKKVPVGDIVRKLDPKKAQWRRMPRVMIEKCAEAKALRRGWPDDFSGLYSEDEIDKAHALDLSATELANEAAEQRRLDAIGGRGAVIVDWCDGNALQRVPSGKFGDQALAFIRQNSEEATHVALWADKNRHTLNEYWALDPNGALEVKKALEPLLAEVPRQAAE